MKVVIVGGGIGGLSAAVALRRAGLDAHVYERASELREVGAAVNVWPNATRVLRGWGLLDGLLAKSGLLVRAQGFTWDGRPLQDVVLGDYGTPAVCVHRADLHALLASALPSEALHLGADFESYRDEDGRVRMRFLEGRDVEAVVLVGADGVRSGVRQQVLGDGDPTYRGYAIWRGITRHAGRGLQPGVSSETHGAGQRFGIVPLGDGRVGWWASANEPRGLTDEPEGRKEKLLRLFGTWRRPIPELIESTPGHAILKNSARDRDPVKVLGRGRVTLLGDAAHPMTPNLGQGACMAIEDAEVLARRLAGAGDDVPAALRAYEAERYQRVAPVVRQSRSYGALGQWEGRAAVRARNLLLRRVPERLERRVLERLFGYEA